MDTVPMDFQFHRDKYTLCREEEEKLKEFRIKIYQKTAPSKCFRDERERAIYFCRVHNINLNNLEEHLTSLALQIFNKPYCFICNEEFKLKIGNGYRIPQYFIIEHEHDDSMKHPFENIIPGRFRTFTCASCNRLEAEARKRTSIRSKVIYWRTKFEEKGYSREKCEYLLFKLEEYSYFNDYFKHN